MQLSRAFEKKKLIIMLMYCFISGSFFCCIECIKLFFYFKFPYQYIFLVLLFVYIC
uniref:Uncharacterized protein n=1 Tax=Arundo donax TaxID=35708 RepID=A0A0A9F7V6_ARUDO